MTLSEAIRLGAMNHPHGRFEFQQSNGATCALGAACDAVGVLDRLLSALQSRESLRESDLILNTAFPILMRRVTWPCGVLEGNPACTNPVGYIITTLNDTYLWTRQQIAEWVASIEALDAEAQPEAVAVCR